MSEPNTPSSELNPKHLMPQLYNMLVAPVKKTTLRTPSASHAGHIQDPSLTWEKIRTNTTKHAHSMPLEQIHGACREKNSRGFIGRSISQNRGQTRPVKRPRKALENAYKSNSDSTSSSNDVPLTANNRSVKSPIQMEEDTSVRNWRVKKVMAEHSDMLRCLSKATISSVPQHLLELQSKQRCSAKDRESVLMYQQQLRDLLATEYAILQQIQTAMRNALYV